MKRLGFAMMVSLAALSGCADPDEAPAEEQDLDERVARAAAERASWGLPSDPSAVGSLLDSGRDVGTERWGIPLSQEEEDALDLPGRMQFADDIKLDLVPFVNALRESGGVYIDQLQNGGLVVLLTEPNEEIAAEIAARIPASDRGVRVARVTHTEAALQGALSRAWDVWKEVAPTIQLQSAGVDIKQNRILFEVADLDIEGASGVQAALEGLLGVRVGVKAAEAPVDTSCTARDHCYSPTKAGTRIFKGAIDGGTGDCTMAFHVVCNDGDIEFVTAGHCGYGGSNSWYIKDGTSDGLLMGSEQVTLYSDGGKDIMRVQLPVGQKSHEVYGESRVYGGSGACPITGQTACASRGTANVVDCGTVRTTSITWVSNTAGYTVHGGDMDNVDSIPGDSGSPIFDRLDSTHWGTVGVLTNSNGNFAVLCQAESGLGITGKAY